MKRCLTRKLRETSLAGGESISNIFWTQSIGLCSFPHTWSWFLDNDWKSAISSTSGRDGNFTKSSRCDTSRQSKQVGIQKDMIVDPLLLRIERSQLRWFGHVTRIPQEGSARKILLDAPTGKRPKGRPTIKWRDYISICLGVDTAELSEITSSFVYTTHGHNDQNFDLTRYSRTAGLSTS